MCSEGGQLSDIVEQTWIPRWGMTTSIVLFGGSEYTEPAGRRLLGSDVPDKIWRRTGTLSGGSQRRYKQRKSNTCVGGLNVTPLTTNWSESRPICILKLTSAAPGSGIPGWRLTRSNTSFPCACMSLTAPGLIRGFPQDNMS